MTNYHIDLSKWNLTKPFDSKGTVTGEAVTLPASGNANVNADGSVTFKAPVNGAKTGGTKYPREELRELSGSDKAAWSLYQTGRMTATLKVESIPFKEDGTGGRVVIGQIHGEANELVRIYWENSTVYYVNDLSTSDNKEHEFYPVDKTGAKPLVSLNEMFSYMIYATPSALTVEIYADGKTYTHTQDPNQVWDKDKLYFKAGVYLGNNSDQKAIGTGQTTFFALDCGHTATAGAGGLVVTDAPATLPPVSTTPPPKPVPDNTSYVTRQELHDLLLAMAEKIGIKT